MNLTDEDFRRYGNVLLRVRQDTPDIGYSWGKTDYLYVDGKTIDIQNQGSKPYARFATTEHFGDVEVRGWARMESEPLSSPQGFQVHVRHQHNDCNLLVGFLRQSRKTGLWIEDDYRPGSPKYTKWFAGPDHVWKVREAHQWKVATKGSLVEAFCCAQPLLSYTDHMIPRTGQIGFRLDGAQVSFGGIVVKELT